MKRITDWESQSIVNFASSEGGPGCALLSEHMFIHRVMGNAGGAKAFLLAKLGRQDYVWTGSVRNWVWERRDAGPRWRAYASVRGFTFEVPEGCSREDGTAAWDDFKERITEGSYDRG